MALGACFHVTIVILKPVFKILIFKIRRRDVLHCKPQQFPHAHGAGFGAHRVHVELEAGQYGLCIVLQHLLAWGGDASFYQGVLITVKNIPCCVHHPVHSHCRYHRGGSTGQNTGKVSPATATTTSCQLLRHQTAVFGKVAGLLPIFIGIVVVVLVVKAIVQIVSVALFFLIVLVDMLLLKFLSQRILGLGCFLLFL